MLIKPIVASFRELGPPDLCHVVKTSGSKSAPKDVSGFRSFRCPAHSLYRWDHTTTGKHSYRPISSMLNLSQLWRRSIIIGISCSIPKLLNIRGGRHGCMVRRQDQHMEGPKRDVLLFQCLLEGRCAGGRKDPRRSRGLRGGFEGREVSTPCESLRRC